MVAEVDAAKKDADTLGGIVEVLAYGVPPGLGSHVQWDRKLDARLAAALMSIQAIKGVEIGDGVHPGPVPRLAWRTTRSSRPPTGVRRVTDRAGGLEGGITTGEPLRVRAAMKPISSLNRALATVDVTTGEPATAINQRSDVCAVPAAAVVAEAMVALVLAEAATEKFGGDSVAEIRRNLAGYLDAPGDPLMAPRRACWSARPAPARPPSGGRSPPPLGVAFRDTDADIEAAAGKPIPEIFIDEGEDALPRPGTGRGGRRAGRRATGVLALGGGAVLAEETRAALAGHTWSTSRSSCPTRSSGSGSAPAGRCWRSTRGPPCKYLLDQRRPLYAEVATAHGGHRRADPGGDRRTRSPPCCRR